MSEDRCDVKDCGEMSVSFFELVRTQPTRFFIFFKGTDFQTKLKPALCKAHYDEFWSLALDLLKGK